MPTLPYLPRFLFGADSEIAPQTIYCFLWIGPTTGLCSLLFQRDPGPSPWTAYDWNYVYYMWQIPHHTPKTPGCCETFWARLARRWNVGRMPSVAIPVISHSVHRSHDRWYFVSMGFRDAVLHYWSCPYSLSPTTFQPHTFLTLLGRNTKSYYLWPTRQWGGEALPNS